MSSEIRDLIVAQTAPLTASGRFAGTKRYLPPLEAAEYCGVGHSTLSIRRMQGLSPAYIKWGTNVRYDVLELDRWMAEMTVTPAAPHVKTPKRPVGRPAKQGVAK